MTLRTVPVELLLEDRLAVCVGACAEVASKVDRLIAGGARVRVVADDAVEPSIAARAAEGAIELVLRAPVDADADGAAIVFCSPRHEALGARLSDRARASGQLVSTLDRPTASTFINPGLARGAGLSFAIGSGGRSPALVRRVRQDLEGALASPELAAFVDRVAELRAAGPPAERAERGREACEGFRVEIRFVFPSWFDGG